LNVTNHSARTRDLDQVFEDVAAPVLKTFSHDVDLPGFGQHYCIQCARHFLSKETYEVHAKTKLHKKRVKVLKNDIAYSQKEAELAVGLKTDNGPGRT
jgi:bud site selection protein 20